ncbi:hypothetical protein D3C86_991740 [compost metagenome]
MDTHIHNIIISINEFDSFLRFAFDLYFLQASKLPDSVVDMRDIIPYRKSSKFF